MVSNELDPQIHKFFIRETVFDTILAKTSTENKLIYHSLTKDE